MAQMSLRQLRSLVVLAEELHFHRAAARLHLTQPALTHQIQQLEQVLGVRLFDREGRRVSLSPAGASLAADARRLLTELERAVDAARHAGMTGLPLHVCHSPSISRILIPRLAEALPNHGLDVVWIERSEEFVGLELMSGRYDLALGRFPPLDGGLEHEVLLCERPGVYLDPDDPLAALDEVPLAALAGRRLRTVRPESVPQHFSATQRDLAAAGLDGQIEATLSYANWDTPELRRDILDGRCVLIGLASARNTLAGVAVVALGPPASPIPVTASWRTAEPRREVAEFVALARTVAASIREPWVASAEQTGPLR